MDGHGIKVLVAGDDESTRSRPALLLEQAECEVHLAADGYDALKPMFKGVIDVVMTDWHMPRLSGADFLSLSRILWPDIPVIIVSTYAVPSLKGIPQGAFAWLIKPYERKELLQILRMAVQTRTLRLRERYFYTAVLP